QKLLQLHRRSDAILNAQTDIVIVTDGTRIVEVNKAFLLFMGFESLDEFTRHYSCISELFESQEGYITPIVDNMNWTRYLLHNKDTISLAMIKKDNKNYSFRLHAKKLSQNNEIVISLVDITHEIEKDLYIQKAKERLELILDATKIGLWEWDLQNDSIRWDPNCYKMLGYEPDAFEVNIVELTSIMHPKDQENVIPIIEKAMQNQTTYVVAFRLRNKQQQWVWIESRGKTIVADSNEMPLTVVGTHIDITKRKEQERELEKLNKDLRKEVKKQVEQITSKDRLLQEQSKLAAMGEMIGAIAHQWRQPLNALSINIQNLDDDYADGLIDTEFIDNFIQKQNSTINFMSKTIDDFRNFFKTDKISVVFSVEEVINEVEHLMHAQLANHNITITTKGDDFSVMGYKSEFKQVILNILSNSKDAIIKNKTAGTISITLQNDEKKISIEDSGGGVDEKILSRIFEPYFTTKENGKGTGIGLHMSKTIIEQHMDASMRAYNCNEGLCTEITFSSD
ncbi:MAG: PAS domain-containing sensor histidine kinase, partial [Campylobacterota bacterium]